HYDDGPFGVRPEVHPNSWQPLGLTTDSATYLPTGSALAATWNPKLAYKYGAVLGQEARARGKDVILGPAINIDRNPNGGRTFEFLTEDPYLDAQLAVAYVEGVQKQGVAACVKHYLANNQETDRESVDEIIGQRVLHEIYMPAFKAVVQKAHVDVVMAAYNKVNGNYCAANPYLLKDVLEKQWGFNGMIISDWGGVHSTVPTALAGLDVEMNGDSDYQHYYFAQPLLDSVKAGKVSVDIINNKVKRILGVMSKLNMLGNGTRPAGSINTLEHHDIAYEVASESIVLLKNSKDLLPLNSSKLKSIAVIGDNATKQQAQLGFGAGVKSREITPLEGLEQKLKGKVTIHFAQGYKEEYENTHSNGPERIPMNKPDMKLIQQAVQAAKAADVAIVVAGNTRTYETEGADRSSLSLPFGENELIKAVTAVNPNTIVVIISGAPVQLNRIDKESSALVWSGFNGIEGGRALADVLFGDVDPSGKLPFTFPKSLSDAPAQMNGSFPGKNDTTEYKERILVGYR
ncbi:MAG: glycoside hydrolase family 3 C-terminal domain-containing protein, partial [Chitinophagaceae bacterium]